MLDIRGPYRNGGALVGLSAMLHLIAPVFGGGSTDALALFVVGLVYAAMAYALLHGLRWVAYIAFLAMIIGSIAALTFVWALGPVPGWLYAVIFGVNWLAVIALFGALWKPAKPVVVQ